MEYLSKIELINKKIEFYDSWIDIPKVEKYKEAIGLFLFYEKDLDQMNKDTLILFLKANLKFNTKTIIYIFTNLDLNLNGFALERVKVTFIPFQDNQIMTNRVVFNFIVTKKFSSFDRLFLFDSDLIPLGSYEDKVEFNFDIGLTYNARRKEIKKYLINAGFSVINYENLKNINQFNLDYLKAYEKIILQEDKLMNKFKFEKPLSEWFGDQMLYYYICKQVPEKNYKIYDFQDTHYKIRYHNDYLYNYGAYELKMQLSKPDKKFKISNFLEECKSFPVYFIHLKDNRRLFAKEIMSYLKLN